MMSTNTEKKKSAVSEDGHVLTAYVFFFFFFFFFFFLVVSLVSMQIKSFWNTFSKIKLRNSTYIIDPSAWPTGSAVRIKKNRPKGKIVLKKRDQTGEKTKRYKETENRVAGSRTRFICTFKQLVDHCTTVTHVIWDIYFVVSIFLCYRRCLKLAELYLSSI